MNTYMAKKGEVVAKWYVVDVTDKVLGRFATEIATILMGKNKPEYTPHVDTGDFVIVVNAEMVRLTGAKLAQKSHEHFTGYLGGRKVVPLARVKEKHPDRIVSEAIRRMLPKSKLGKAMLDKLKVYAGPDHPHQAQNPQPLEL